ncbi:MAG: hypothetical protein OHK0013_21370 [Sandaracinaceae bacterium]
MVHGPFGTTFPCPRCGAALPSGAAFCDRCGADVRAAAALAASAHAAQPVMRARPGFVAVGRGMSVCHACGALAPSARTSCEVCSQPIGSSLEAVPPRSDDLSFAQVRVRITCRQCGGTFPLDEPELDEAVTCPRCSTTQAFDLGAWSEAFAHAHLVADLYGPRGAAFRRSLPAGRDPSPGLGESTAISELILSGMSIDAGVMRTRNLHAACAPGHPLCKKCGSPREPMPLAGMRGAPELQMKCVGCGDTARYAIPSAAPGLAPTLVGFVAEALRVDRPEARLDGTSAGLVIALRCPSCGAGLNVTPGSHVAVCTFCKTEARIASRTLLALRSVGGEPEPWWAIFRGDAPGRAGLLAGPASGADPMLSLREMMAADSVGDARLAALLAMAEAPGGDKVLNRAVADKVKPIEDDISPRGKRLEWALQLTIPAILLVLVSPIFYRQILRWARGAVSVEPSIAAPASGQVLAPGVPITIMLQHDGEWRPVCDNLFGMEEANVACRQLGFAGASSYQTVTGNTDEFWLDDLDCTGAELRLDDCRHLGWGDENCSRSETQAVTCF